MSSLSADTLQLYREAQQRSPAEFEPILFRLIGAYIPLSSAVFAEMQFGPAGVRPYGMQLHNEPERIAEELPRLNQRHDAVMQLVTNRPRRAHAVLQRQLFSRPDQREMLEYVRRYGHANVMAIADIAHPRARGAWVSLYRAREDHVFCPAEQRLLTVLMPHLVQANSVNREINAVPRMLGGSMGMRALVTHAGVVIAAGSGFRQAVRRHWPDWRSARLPGDLIETLRSSGAPAQGATAGISVVQHPFERHLLLEARPAQAAADLLSVRQRQIAVLFARGFSHKHIARMLELSPATVRNVVPHVYRKLHVNNRVALARLLPIETDQPL